MEGFRENEVHSLNGLHLTALWQFVWTRERLEMMVISNSCSTYNFKISRLIRVLNFFTVFLPMQF